MRVGILTGGGDCPGLNAVIYGAILKANQHNVEAVGIKKGWKLFTLPFETITKEIIQKYVVPLNVVDHDDLQTKGGTILFSSRSNPFKKMEELEFEKAFKKKAQEAGMTVEQAKKEKITLDKQQKDEIRASVRKIISPTILKIMKLIGIDALIPIGGDDTCGIAAALYENTNRDAKVVVCPKTIDNDLAGTDYTFGFFSSAQLASNSLDNLTTTAHSHQRIFVVEIMGRDAGWLTLYAGLSAGADIILLPEMPFDLQKDIVDVLKRRVKLGHTHHIIACSEGAHPKLDTITRDFHTITQQMLDDLPEDDFGNKLLTKLNIAGKIEIELRKYCPELNRYFLEHDMEYDVRSVVLGHTMRSGTPNVFDRVLGLRYGWHAMSYVIDGNFGKMTSLQGTDIVPVNIMDGVKKKWVQLESDLLEIRDALTK